MQVVGPLRLQQKPKSHAADFDCAGCVGLPQGSGETFQKPTFPVFRPMGGPLPAGHVFGAPDVKRGIAEFAEAQAALDGPVARAGRNPRKPHGPTECARAGGPTPPPTTRSSRAVRPCRGRVAFPGRLG